MPASTKFVVHTHDIGFATALLAKLEEARQTDQCSYYDLLGTPEQTGFVLAASHPRWDTQKRTVVESDGCRTKEIALQLGISARTVEHHKYTMMHQLNMRTTAELVAHAVRQKLVS